MACEKWLDHYGLWKEWQKNCRNPWLHKILVLLGIVKSPTFEYFRAFKGSNPIRDGINDVLEEVERIYGEET